MSHIFNLGDLDDFSEKVNLDELYEKKRQYDLRKLELFNKMLHRVHHKIKITSRQKLEDQYCWFVVPEIMIGVPKYNQGECIAYIRDKLKTNGFICKYIHPNVLFISWKHWIPSYVRDEFKKKAGLNINGFGKIIKEEIKPKALPFTIKQNANKNYKSINEYTPQNMVYNTKLESKTNEKLLKLNS